jgi:hypothetical protein
VTTTVSAPKAGHDVRYFTNAQGGGCTGAMAYYTKNGDPPGRWAGHGAEQLGLAGMVDPQVIDNLYMKNISPTGGQLAKPPDPHDGVSDAAVARAVHAYRRAHPFASVTELDEVRTRERAKRARK